MTRMLKNDLPRFIYIQSLSRVRKIERAQGRIQDFSQEGVDHKETTNLTTIFTAFNINFQPRLMFYFNRQNTSCIRKLKVISGGGGGA